MRRRDSLFDTSGAAVVYVIRKLEIQPVLVTNHGYLFFTAYSKFQELSVYFRTLVGDMVLEWAETLNGH